MTTPLRVYSGLLLLLCIGLFACSGDYDDYPAEPEAVLTRSGVLLYLGHDLSARKVHTCYWKEGGNTLEIKPEKITDKILRITRYNINATTVEIVLRLKNNNEISFEATLPEHPSLYPIAKYPLTRFVSLNPLEGVKQHPSVVKLNRDGELALIGTNQGHLAMLKTRKGMRLYEKKFHQSYIKYACWHPNSKHFYIGIQGQSSGIFAFKLEYNDQVKETWQFPFTKQHKDIVNSKIIENLDWVQKPGPFGLKMVDNGDLLTVSRASWTENQQARCESRLLRIDSKSGKLVWPWPEEPLQLAIPWFSSTDDGRLITLIAYPPGYAGEGKTDTPQSQLYLIDGEKGETLASCTIEPLAPYFQKATLWRGIRISPDGNRIAVSLDDGRLLGYEIQRDGDAYNLKLDHREDLATPFSVADVPVLCLAGQIVSNERQFSITTGESYIPFSHNKGLQQLPSEHPHAYRLWWFDWCTFEAVSYKLPAHSQNIIYRKGQVGKFIGIALSKVTNYTEQDLNGMLLYQIRLKDTLDTPFSYYIEGPVPYDGFDISTDGLVIALVETKVELSDGSWRGQNRLHVVW